VIGYGKLGRSIATLLRSNGIQVRVYDIDAVRLTEAHSHGFPIAQSLREALRNAGLVMCATGRLSLRRADFRAIANGAYVATVTSSDDELELSDLKVTYRTHDVAQHVTRYTTTGHYFHILNRGNAVNFLHGAVVGPAIYLVQAELITCAARLAERRDTPLRGLVELESDARTRIAEAWIEAFGEIAI
jgi:adenosylhomocysteinase